LNDKKQNEPKRKHEPELKVQISVSVRNEFLGNMIFKLYHKTVPKTVKNFASLIKGSANMGYKGSVFHRIIPGFMAQGGDYERGNGTGGSSIYGRTFEDENFKINHNKRGQLSMANSGPNTNGSQFFILFADQPHLNGKHVVFGEMINGLDILDIIEDYGSSDGTTAETIKIMDCKLI
jgi:peptidyl-prolyl isomerase G (cyclophilin G)